MGNQSKHYCKHNKNLSVHVYTRLNHQKELNKCNANVNIMKTGSSIEMIDLKDYKKAYPHIYQRLVRKLIYFLCRIRSDITFIIGQLSRHNADPCKKYL